MSVLDYAISLQRAIEYHCRGVGQKIPPSIGKRCPHHAKMLDEHVAANDSEYARGFRDGQYGLGVEDGYKQAEEDKK